MSKQASKPKAAAPKKEFLAAGNRYWKNPININGETVGGKVTEAQEVHFRACAPEADIMGWTTATDEVAAKRKALKAKRRREIGLEPED